MQVTDHGGKGRQMKRVDTLESTEGRRRRRRIAIEIWKPINGYEGLYEISSYGRVKSLCAGRWHTTIIRKLVPDKDGYMTVLLKKDGKYTNLKVHRLVAMAFLPNPDNCREVNHKDEDKANNRIENLEWCSRQYNQTYNGLHSRVFCKPIIQLSPSGVEIARYDSIRNAMKATGANETCISEVLNNKRKTAGGFIWAYLY